MVTPITSGIFTTHVTCASALRFPGDLLQRTTLGCLLFSEVGHYFNVIYIQHGVTVNVTIYFLHIFKASGRLALCLVHQPWLLLLHLLHFAAFCLLVGLLFFTFTALCLPVNALQFFAIVVSVTLNLKFLQYVICFAKFLQLEHVPFLLCLVCGLLWIIIEQPTEPLDLLIKSLLFTLKKP